MKHLATLTLALPLFAGCLSSAPQAPTNWTIDFSRSTAKPTRTADAAAGAVRISLVDVRAPYSGQRLAVLRSDGSVAFDPFNAFAGSPSQLLKGAAFDIVELSGKFGRVVTSSSVAQAQYAMEIVVTELALDCRVAGKRMARVALALTLLKGREAVSVVRGEGTEEADADYSAAFSTAFARAMNDALGQLSVK